MILTCGAALFHPEVQAALVSHSNPYGTITNSNLEHAVVICQTAVMANDHDVRHCTILTGTNNTPTISRVNKGTVTSEGPAAGLCHLACAHQRHHRCCLKVGFLPGEVNVMSDDSSRMQHLSDTELLSHFEQLCLQPTPWVLHHLPSQTVSLMISALVSKQPSVPLLGGLSTPKNAPSTAGQSSATKSGAPKPSIPWTTKKQNTFSSSLTASSTEPMAPVTNLCELRTVSGSMYGHGTQEPGP